MTELEFRQFVLSAFQTDDESALNSTKRRMRCRTLQDRIKVKQAFKAAERRDLEALKKLVKNAVQANWLDDKGQLCLLDQAVFAESLPVVKWLLDMGADPCTLLHGDYLHPVVEPFRPGMYFSPFATAINLKTPDIALLLLQHGASPDLPIWCGPDGEIRTCQQFAAEKGHWPALEAWLISQAAKQAQRTSKGSTRL